MVLQVDNQLSNFSTAYPTPQPQSHPHPQPHPHPHPQPDLYGQCCTRVDLSTCGLLSLVTSLRFTMVQFFFLNPFVYCSFHQHDTVLGNFNAVDFSFAFFLPDNVPHLLLRQDFRTLLFVCFFTPIASIIVDFLRHFSRFLDLQTLWTPSLLSHITIEHLTDSFTCTLWSSPYRVIWNEDDPVTLRFLLQCLIYDLTALVCLSMRTLVEGSRNRHPAHSAEIF